MTGFAYQVTMEFPNTRRSCNEPPFQAQYVCGLVTSTLPESDALLTTTFISGVTVAAADSAHADPSPPVLDAGNAPPEASPWNALVLF